MPKKEMWIFFGKNTHFSDKKYKFNGFFMVLYCAKRRQNFPMKNPAVRAGGFAATLEMRFNGSFDAKEGSYRLHGPRG